MRIAGAGAIVDASIVSSSRRPFKVIDVLPEDREEDDAEASDVTVSYSDDADAAWLRKGNRAYYGYKIHAAMDSRDGFLFGGHVTPANRSDPQNLLTFWTRSAPWQGLHLCGQGVQQPIESAYASGSGAYGRHHAQSRLQPSAQRRRESGKPPDQKCPFKGGTRLRYAQTGIWILQDVLPGDVQDRVRISAQCHGLQPEKSSLHGGKLRTVTPERRCKPPSGEKTAPLDAHRRRKPLLEPEKSSHRLPARIMQRSL
jgi:hypothetical protein